MKIKKFLLLTLVVILVLSFIPNVTSIDLKENKEILTKPDNVIFGFIYGKVLVEEINYGGYLKIKDGALYLNFHIVGTVVSKDDNILLPGLDIYKFFIFFYNLAPQYFFRIFGQTIEPGTKINMTVKILQVTWMFDYFNEILEPGEILVFPYANVYGYIISFQ